MDVDVRFVEGMTFVARGPANHLVVIDGDPQVGGYGAGPRPMELVLMGLGGCTGMDVVSILRKRRIQVEEFRLQIRAERREDHPKAFRRIEMEYVFRGAGLEGHEKELTDTVRLSQEKYCSVAASLRPGCELTYRVTINPPAMAEGEPATGSRSSNLLA